MEWHINDLSLQGQFDRIEDVKAALGEVLTLRSRRPDLRSRIYCSKGLLTRPVTTTHTLQQALVDLHDREFFSAAVRWLGNSGPFWDDSRQGNDDDLFHWKKEDVTDQGLGEAARRRLAAIDAAAFSFVQPQTEFDVDPLGITHGLLEEPIGTVQVPNDRTLNEIEATPVVALTGWESMLVLASAKAHLHLASNLIEDLKPRPFHAGIAERLLQLLTVLDEISAEVQADGNLTEKGVALQQQYFVGRKALFSGEDAKDENTFKFPDPSGSDPLDCPMHGKVKMGGQFRIHFQWPKPKGQALLKVVYIGEKLTKQ